MSHQSTELPADLAAAQQQFTRWRATHPPRTRFPEELWQLAVHLAGHYGHHQVCKALKLDYYSLKKHRESCRPSFHPAPAFVALEPGIRPGGTIECRNGEGHCLRISLPGSSLSELTSLCIELWRVLR